jgi:hypothetical protein
MINKIKSLIFGKPQDVPIKKAKLKRNSKWWAVRSEHLKHCAACVVCRSTNDVQVHHKKPFHLFPELELDPLNLISLCGEGGHNCHLVFGHLCDFSSYNEEIDQDAKRMYKKIIKRPN